LIEKFPSVALPLHAMNLISSPLDLSVCMGVARIKSMILSNRCFSIPIPWKLNLSFTRTRPGRRLGQIFFAPLALRFPQRFSDIKKFTGAFFFISSSPPRLLQSSAPIGTFLLRNPRHRRPARRLRQYAFFFSVGFPSSAAFSSPSPLLPPPPPR